MHRLDPIVHLFEWRWDDIAIEAERYLGPMGYGAVLISPPNEHTLIEGAPWWQRYQPVSYRLDRCRSGTLEQLRSMIARCRAVGVEVYADAVINHMAGSPPGRQPVGSAGSSYSRYHYPGVYDEHDFHPERVQLRDADLRESRDRVFTRELKGLPDLDTGSAKVQAAIADYLVSLARIGVTGFRIDAAKHIDPAELDQILKRVEQQLGWRPYCFLEVMDHDGEVVSARDYLDVLDGEVAVTDFQYCRAVADTFAALGRNTGEHALASLPQRLQAAGLLPPERALSFVDNHDRQREGGLSHADGLAHRLATLFMLAWPHGRPMVMSSYGFDRDTPQGRNAGPPSDDDGNTMGPYDGDEPAPLRIGTGPGTWLCEHRWPDFAGMIDFRRAAGSEQVTDWGDDGGNLIAFGRGACGFFIINGRKERVTQRFTCSLPPGRYRNVMALGEDVEVGPDGGFRASIPPFSAFAFHAGTLAR